MMDFVWKKVLVLGLAKSGVAAAQALVKRHALVTVNDSKTEEQLSEDIKALSHLPVKIVTGGHPMELFDLGFDLIVKNPGIPYDIPFLKEARAKNIQIISEPEFAFQISKAPMVAITGSNGKTTTTAWVGEILQRARPNVHVAGNIGLPLSTEAEGLGPESLLVVEMSSFQLNDILDFKPKVAVLLNIFPAHLDWHHTEEHYIKAKSNIFKNQDKDDYAVLNQDCPKVMAIKEGIKAQVLTFSALGPVSQGAWIEDEKIYLRVGSLETLLLNCSQLGIGYAHNWQNAMAAALVSYGAGADLESIREGLKGFKGVKHRFQEVAEKEGILYINDSKATNNQAAITALNLPARPIIWIAGGLDRGQDLGELMAVGELRCKGSVFLGQIKDRMMSEALAKGMSNITLAQDMEEAVKKARKMAEPGDVILLSPACASWDMYASFEHRGDDYIGQVEKL